MKPRTRRDATPNQILEREISRQKVKLLQKAGILPKDLAVWEGKIHPKLRLNTVYERTLLSSYRKDGICARQRYVKANS